MNESIYVVAVPYAGLYNKPDKDWDLHEANLLETEVLHGERIEVIENDGEWAKVRALLDNYPGFVRMKDLVPECERHPTTHLVNVPQVALYTGCTFKSTLSEESLTLPMNARVHAQSTFQTPEGNMLCLEGLGWVFEDEMRPIDTYEPDFVAVAKKLLGARYKWGARSGVLLDCSAHLQAACIAAGRDCPRNVGQQVELGEPVDFARDFSNLVRGDLVFWTHGKGRHIAIMDDPVNAQHVTIAAPYRGGVLQPLAGIIADQARDGNGPVTAVRRFADYHPA